MEVFDDCGSVVKQLQSPVIQGKSNKKLRRDMAKVLENDLNRLHKEILKL